jgi:glycosyltransferase involved in cell wall biosynthesis
MVDAVPSDQVVDFVSGADCSVVAIQNVCLSYYFCLPNKLFESVLAGLPIAAANLLELRRFVEDIGVGVVMDETDPKDIARAIGELLANREKYRPTAEKVRDISRRYGWPVQERRLLELYRRIAADELQATTH